MRFFRRFTKPVTPVVPEFAFCEPVSATATSHWHIRRVGEEGLKLGGGIPRSGVVLCGSERMERGGWDRSREVDRETVFADSRPRPGDDRVFVCPDCAEAYLSLPA